MNCKPAIHLKAVDRVTTCRENLEMSGILVIVGEMSGIMIKVRKFQGSIREFHNVWKVGTLILTFAHIVVAIPVFSMTN
jgi:hypothetical protein